MYKSIIHLFILITVPLPLQEKKEECGESFEKSEVPGCGIVAAGPGGAFSMLVSFLMLLGLCLLGNVAEGE